MKRKHISSKKVRIKRGGSWINGNCFVKRITHFKFRDSFLHSIRDVGGYKKINTVVRRSYYLEEKGWEITNREEGFLLRSKVNRDDFSIKPLFFCHIGRVG